MPERMVQIKFTIDCSTVSAFKARCASQGVSMTSVVSQFMKTCQPSRCMPVNTETRGQRKKAVTELVGLLECIMQNEEDYRDAIPTQFESRYEKADYSCEQLAQAIYCLEDAY
jgi:antitoxin component of RelBE/YafQ-DinJ toxin-antitoxin module